MLWWNYQQLRVSSAKTRLAVIQKLADNRDPDAAGPLIFALQDKDANVRAAAAKALSGFHDQRSLEPLRTCDDATAGGRPREERVCPSIGVP